MIIKNSVIYGVETKNNATIALQDKSVTENGTYTADSGYDGLGTVTVNVSGGGDNEYDTWIFENISGQTAELSFSGSYKNGSYSLDGGVTWINLPSNSDGWSTTMNHKINFDNIVCVKYNDVVRDYSIYMFSCNKSYNLSGDLYKSYKPYMYSCALDLNSNLIDASGLVFHGDTAGFHSLDRMFNGCRALTTTPAILPATKLWNYCYNSMFINCNSLTTAPAILPATTLVNSCYSNMFQGCKSLTTAPELPATTLAEGCYQAMFSGCTSLTTAPALPATTLAPYCYGEMFNGCTNLNKVTTYAQDISAYYCLNYWLNRVAAQGNFYNLGNPAPTYPSGGSGIPTGWAEHTSL